MVISCLTIIPVFFNITESDDDREEKLCSYFGKEGISTATSQYHGQITEPPTKREFPFSLMSKYHSRTWEEGVITTYFVSCPHPVPKN